MEARIEIYGNKTTGFRWRLRDGNGEIVIPPEKHPTKANVLRAIENIKTTLADAPVVVIPDKKVKSA